MPTNHRRTDDEILCDRIVANIRAAGLADDVRDFRLYPWCRAYLEMGCPRALLVAAKPEDALRMVRQAWERKQEAA